MHYQDGVWVWQINEERIRPTPVVPIVFYHGEEKWMLKPWKDYLQGWDEVFAPFTPPGGCIFISLSDMTDEEIKGFRYGFLVAALLLMKHRMEKEYLLEHLPEIFNFVESDPLEGSLDNRIENLKYALRYLQGLKAVKWREAREKLHSLHITYQVMDVWEELKIESFQEGLEEGIEKGREKGREEGREEGIVKEKFFACRNMIHQGFADNLIAGVLEVSLEYVQQVKQQLGKEEQVAHLLKSGGLEDDQIARALEVSPFLVEAVRKKLNKKAG